MTLSSQNTYSQYPRCGNLIGTFRCRRFQAAPGRRRDATTANKRTRDTAMSENGSTSRATLAMTSNEDFAQLDDSALLSRRAEMRAELERLPPASPAHATLTALYDKSTEEIDERARKAWNGPDRE